MKFIFVSSFLLSVPQFTPVYSCIIVDNKKESYCSKLFAVLKISNFIHSSHALLFLQQTDPLHQEAPSSTPSSPRNPSASPGRLQSKTATAPSPATPWSAVTPRRTCGPASHPAHPPQAVWWRTWSTRTTTCSVSVPSTSTVPVSPSKDDRSRSSFRSVRSCTKLWLLQSACTILPRFFLNCSRDNQISVLKALVSLSLSPSKKCNSNSSLGYYVGRYKIQPVYQLSNSFRSIHSLFNHGSYSSTYRSIYIRSCSIDYDHTL